MYTYLSYSRVSTQVVTLHEWMKTQPYESMNFNSIPGKYPHDCAKVTSYEKCPWVLTQETTVSPSPWHIAKGTRILVLGVGRLHEILQYNYWLSVSDVYNDVRFTEKTHYSHSCWDWKWRWPRNQDQVEVCHCSCMDGHEPLRPPSSALHKSVSLLQPVGESYGREFISSRMD